MNGNLLDLTKGHYKPYPPSPQRFPGTETTKAVSTGVAHDEIDTLILKDRVRSESLLDFIKNAIATVPGVKPEETTYGRAIAQLVKEHGSPVIRQKEWSGEPDDAPAYFEEDLRDPSLSSWPVDTVTTTPGDVSDLISELAHQRQFNVSPEERAKLNLRFQLENELYKPKYPHDFEGTLEWEAHTGKWEPQVKERFETILDSLQSIHGKSGQSPEKDIYGRLLPMDFDPWRHFDPWRNQK